MLNTPQNTAPRPALLRPALLAALALPLVGSALGGCATQDQLENERQTATSLEASLTRLQQENQGLRSTVDRQASEIDRLRGVESDLRNRTGSLQTEADVLQSNLDQLEDQISNISISGQDPRIDRALRRLAAGNSNLFIYDAERSMIRLSSDLSFNAGSDVVRKEAESGLAKLANVLVDAQGDYDIRVVGHTDSQRISNPTTKAKHPTNRHLAVHRAIAVSEAIQKAGWPANRVEVAGWGSQRPAVLNNERGGTPQNRRVEIYIVASTAGAALPVADDAQAEPARPAQPAPPASRYPVK